MIEIFAKIQVDWELLKDGRDSVEILQEVAGNVCVTYVLLIRN